MKEEHWVALACLLCGALGLVAYGLWLVYR